jgi:hypothetical protein
LVGYTNRYKVALACQVVDPTVDRFDEERIAVSNPFTITGGSVIILVNYKGTKMEGVAKTGGQTQFTAFLFPKDEDVRSIKRLSDVPKYGGILLLPTGD